MCWKKSTQENANQDLFGGIQMVTKLNHNITYEFIPSNPKTIQTLNA